MLTPIDVLAIGDDSRVAGFAHCALLARERGEVRDIYVAGCNGWVMSRSDVITLDHKEWPWVLDPTALAAHAKENKIGLTIVTAEKNIAAGFPSAFRKLGVPIAAPCQDAFDYTEGSRKLMKYMLRGAKVRTAPFKAYTKLWGAIRCVRSYYRNGKRPVIKFGGIAGGQGTLLPKSLVEAEAMLEVIFAGQFGKVTEYTAVVIEDFIPGVEISAQAFCYGEQFVPMQLSQDSKRLLVGDEGPNTGSMGAFAPVYGFGDEYREKYIDPIFAKILRYLKDTFAAFHGIMCLDLMVPEDGSGPYVMDTNARGGGPQIELEMVRMGAEFIRHARFAADGKYKPPYKGFDGGPVQVGICLADEKYPKEGDGGHLITGLEILEGDPTVHFFHGGTVWDPVSQTFTTQEGKGRVGTVIATGSNVAVGRLRAIEVADQINFRGRRFRPDIALKEEIKLRELGIIH